MPLGGIPLLWHNGDWMRQEGVRPASWRLIREKSGFGAQRGETSLLGTIPEAGLFFSSIIPSPLIPRNIVALW